MAPLAHLDPLDSPDLLVPMALLDPLVLVVTMVLLV